jgi:hypothetical protein
MTKPKQGLLTLVEAKREFATAAKVFETYAEKTKHLGPSAILISCLGDRVYVRSGYPDTPWVPLLYGAANLMARDGCSPDEVKETFEDFIKSVIVKQCEGYIPPPTGPFDVFEMILGFFADEMLLVFEKMGPMNDGQTLAERVGGKEVLKRKLTGYWLDAVAQIIAESKPALGNTQTTVSMKRPLCDSERDILRNAWTDNGFVDAARFEDCDPNGDARAAAHYGAFTEK